MLRSELNKSLPRLLELITKETLRKYGTDQSEDTLVVRKSEVTEKMLVEFIAQFLTKEGFQFHTHGPMNHSLDYEAI